MSEAADPQNCRIRKAVIPAAGYGTRLFPATKAVRKGLFPIVDRQGRAIPIILAIVEEALSAGIEEVGIVVQPSDRQSFEDFFKTRPAGEYLHKLLPQHEAAVEYLQGVARHITLLTQNTQAGFGHAVFCAKDWIHNQPFLLLLGDHVYTSTTAASCAQQLLEVFQATGKSTIGVEITPAQEISQRGCVTGSWREPNTLLDIAQLYEKPSVDYAQHHLRVAGLAPDQLLSIFGLYALTPQIFDYLENQIQHNLRERGEFQLTSSLDKLRQDRGMLGYLVKGRSFDTGQPQAYRQAMIEFGGGADASRSMGSN